MNNHMTIQNKFFGKVLPEGNKDEWDYIDEQLSSHNVVYKARTVKNTRFWVISTPELMPHEDGHPVLPVKLMAGHQIQPVDENYGDSWFRGATKVPWEYYSPEMASPTIPKTAKAVKVTKVL